MCGGANGDAPTGVGGPRHMSSTEAGTTLGTPAIGSGGREFCMSGSAINDEDWLDVRKLSDMPGYREGVILDEAILDDVMLDVAKLEETIVGCVRSEDMTLDGAPLEGTMTMLVEVMLEAVRVMLEGVKLDGAMLDWVKFGASILDETDNDEGGAGPAGGTAPPVAGARLLGGPSSHCCPIGCCCLCGDCSNGA